MEYRFDDFTLDIDRASLRRDTDEIALEPRAFALLSLLIANHDRLVSKDELIEKVWDGRFVSDSAISTVIKNARRALDDDGVAQRYIKTIHGRGFRFNGNVRLSSARVAEPLAEDPGPPTGSDESAKNSPRPALAILPFELIGYSNEYSAIADAVPTELISSLSRLRWLKVVSRGSTFRFRRDNVDLQTILVSLGANYCLSGIVEILGLDLTIAVELSDTRSENVIWSERFPGRIGDIYQTRSDIVTHVISALELHIPLNEAERARLNSPANLDAWGVYHLGLQHMYRFNRADNQIAAGHFERATQLDPNFARAYAARSFTSFQNAFLNYTPDKTAEVENARRHAERSTELDPVDPFGNFTLGRAHWLRGDPESGLPWIERAVGLSPNFAQGFYAHAWADTMAGRGDAALDKVNKAIALSPLDPFLYAMLSTRGLAYLQQGDLANAALWAERGARAPGAHFLINAISAAISQLKGDHDTAALRARSVLDRRPDTSLETFFNAFPFENGAAREALSEALLALGFNSGAGGTE